VECRSRRSAIWLLSFGIFFSSGILAFSQQATESPDIPRNFKQDIETAARLRAQLLEQSVAPTGKYASGKMVFERLIQQLAASSNLRSPNPKPNWELRIVEDEDLNAYASPDGTVYVESGLARLAGSSTGLWAAILSHEIAHIQRRDWARRYLFQRSLEQGNGATIVLGDPGIPSASWKDSDKASQELARFCRELEVEADREGLMLMARAGYHPDFMPALHHLLHAASSGGATRSLYAMHPCWEERDQELARAYTDASIAFAHSWPEWYASPGGNPPVVVFAEEPRLRRANSGEWQIEVPIRCQNLAGAVEVVLTTTSRSEADRLRILENRSSSAPDTELRELTGCTSPKTTVSFPLLDGGRHGQSGPHWTDVYVLDAWGMVLARTDIPSRGR
jgi:hypothetical protein